MNSVKDCVNKNETTKIFILFGCFFILSMFGFVSDTDKLLILCAFFDYNMMCMKLKIVNTFLRLDIC